ncbi:FYN-binding protein 1 [Sylvia atricapilla]|uniref:FYN-binding protein 1 n=1 Tax=Sylvia atricapilla TaxID=48155 RepID=UPI0033934266
MEKFERCNRNAEDASSSRPLKMPRQDSPTGIQTRKAALEKLASQGLAVCSSGPSTLHKPGQPKPPSAVKPSSDDKTEKDPNPPHLNPVAQRFGVQLQPTKRGRDEKTGCTKLSVKTNDLSKEDPKPSNPKPARDKFLAPPDKEKNPLGPKPNFNFASQENEAKPEFSRVAAVKEKLRSATQENEPKPSVSKPPLAQKCSLNKVSQNEDTSNKSGFLQRQSGGPRTNIHRLQEAKEMGESSNSAAEDAGSHFPKITLKPTSHRSSLSKVTKTVVDNTEEKGMSAARNIFVNKIMPEEAGSSRKFNKTNTTFAAGRTSGEPQEKANGDKGSGMPKRIILPAVFKLDQPPQKPSRPSTVHLGAFQRSCPKKNPENEDSKQKVPSSAALAPPVPPSHSTVQLPPLPPASHPSLQMPAAPSLPPRNVKPVSETINLDNEENYDDVEFVSQGHGNTQTGQESDGEMYEDINDIRSTRPKEKWQKEDKRRMEQEKKEQKEKEKKEQELRKKFKLTGPIEVLHQARACTDHKGRKGELTFKQGDKIEIIRLTDNPEGKWLGRIKGCYGYIKTTMVEIDYDSLKRKQKSSTRAAVKHTESDQETYDDVGNQDTTSSQSGDQGGDGSMVQSPPSDQDIYDEIDDKDARSVSQDEDKNGIWPWGILKRLKVKDDKKKSVREKTAKVNEAEENENLFISSSTKQSGKDYGDDVYDDVDSSDFPPPPLDPSPSASGSFGKTKSDEKDVQKLKKMEKEEKEFRKKFKFDGEIKVLYSTTTVQELSQKRWGYKDLQIKPGESLDIIESTDDTKVLCRNEEGKYGYVLRSNLVQNDGEIYDDIGDDCIYDNESDAELS